MNLVDNSFLWGVKYKTKILQIRFVDGCTAFLPGLKYKGKSVRIKKSGSRLPDFCSLLQDARGFTCKY